MPRTKCGPLSRIRAFCDELVLLFSQVHETFSSRFAAQRFRHARSEGRYHGQRMLHFDDIRWHLATTRRRDARAAPGHGIAGVRASCWGLCYLAFSRPMAFSTRRTPGTSAATEPARLISNGVAIRPWR